MSAHRILLSLILLLGVNASMVVHAEETSIAVSANFSAPIQKLALAFHEETGHEVKVSLGSTGKFYAQIQNGAPFDILLAADQETPQRLENEKLGLENTRFTYATGVLALWSRGEGFIDSKGEILQKSTYRHLAIADPKLAPYGLAAIQVITKLGLLDKVKYKLVQGENINQTFQFVATGNAEMGFVALSQIFLDSKIKEGSAWIVPVGLYQPLHQDAILLIPGKDNSAAKAFLLYLKTEKAKKIMRQYGYQF